MDLKSFNLGKRLLYISPLVESLTVNVPIPFAVLLPAYSEGEVVLAKEIVAALLDLGCIEFCCVGNLAEQLHDSIDEIIEDREMFSIVTTFHNDVSEACEYFVFAAGGGMPSLLAFTAHHPLIDACLVALIGGHV